MAIDVALASFVKDRARNRCEYCQLPADCSSLPLEFDHITAGQHGGTAISGNLALACFACNHYKGPNLSGVDPKTGKRAWLFNPRRHKWSRHFRWDGPIIVGRTRIGRATIAVLQINAGHRVVQRAALIAEGVFPPKDR